MTGTHRLFSNSRILPAIAAFLLVAAGTLARLSAPDWDSYAGLHADERHMAFMVSDAVRGLEAWNQGKVNLSLGGLWFDSAQSPLNPRQHSGFYVYGELPLLLASAWTYVSGQSEWTEILKTGRLISGLADSFTILLVFLVASAWTRSRWVPVLACGLYAAAPLALREAHFFTVDTMSTLFGTASVLAASLWNPAGSSRTQTILAVAAGLCLGLAAASKPSGIGFAFALIFVVAAQLTTDRRWSWQTVVLLLFAAVAASVLSFRIANPYAFSGPAFWQLLPETRFLDDLSEQAGLANAGLGWVPNWYWHERNGLLTLLRDLALVGFGPSLVVLFVAGSLLGRDRLPANAIAGLGFIAILTMTFAFYPSPYLRYALPLTPIVCIVAAMAVRDENARLLRFAAPLLLAGTIVQGHAVLDMMSAPHPRVEASAYIWNTYPRGSTVLNETPWDETLPVPVRLKGDKDARWPFAEGAYKLALLDIQEPDNSSKAEFIARRLADADVLVLSSQRFATNMIRLKSHFPLSARFYRGLNDGSICMALTKEFRHDLLLAGFLTLDDSWLQESWYIYDHPVVRIYEKLPCFEQEHVRQHLIQGLPR